MSDELARVYKAVEDQHREKGALTRRRLVAGTAATLGGLGLLSTPFASPASAQDGNDTQTILNVAATAEILATIVNTEGAKVRGLDDQTRTNVKAAAREELFHYRTLVDLGAKPLADEIWVPDAVFASPEGLLNTLQAGDQVFINAYLIATRFFGNAGNGQLATFAAEFMGVEAVHRALARQSLGLLGNDRVYMKFFQEETAPGAPRRGQEGFQVITDAVGILQGFGFGFGARGSAPGRFYDFQQIRQRVPNVKGINTLAPVA